MVCHLEKKFRATRVRIFVIFCRAKREFFFQKLTLGYMTKNSESDYFLIPPPKSEYFFQQHWESEYFWNVNRTPT